MASQMNATSPKSAPVRDTKTLPVFAVVAVCIGTAIVAHFGEFGIGVLGPSFERDIHIDPSQLGLLMALMFFCSAIGGIPSGFIADRVDGKKIILFSVIWGSISFGMFAAALSAGQLFLAAAMCGLGISMNNPLTNRLIVDYVPDESRRNAIAWKSIGLPASGLVTGLTFGLTEPFADWRATSTVVVVLMLLLGVSAHFIFRGAKRIRHVGVQAPAVPENADAAAAPVPEVSAQRAAAIEHWNGRIANPIIWWMIPFSALTVGAFTAVGTYMVIYGTTEAGVSTAAAANASGIAAGISILCRFVWVRWLRARNEPFMLMLTAFSSALALFMLAISPAFGPIGFWIAAIAVGITVLANSPVSQVIQLRNTNPLYIGRVSSVVGVASYLSLAGMPFLISMFIDTLGMQTTWFIAVGLTVIGGLIMLTFALTHRDRHEHLA